jgi:hypothetical protein
VDFWNGRRIALIARQLCWCLAITVLLGAQASADAPPGVSDLRFTVLDGDKPVGHLLIQLAANGDELTMNSSLEATVHRLLIKATLTQHVEEHWAAGKFQSLSSSVKAVSTLGDQAHTLKVQRNPDGTLTAQSDKGTQHLPADAVPLTFWGKPVNRSGPAFDAGTGDLYDVSLSPAKDQQPLNYAGQSCQPWLVQATGKSKAKVIMWLDADSTPCGMRVPAVGGDLNYRREAAAVAP